MAETGAIFGGEHSAHYYFRDNFRADSGLIAAMVVLEQLSIAGEPLSELRRPFERYVDSGEINTRSTTRPPSSSAVRGVRRRRRTGSTGSPSTWGDWWFNLRPSNTEPLLRLNLEAADAAAARRTAEVLALVRGEAVGRRLATEARRARTKGDTWPWTPSCSRSSPAPRTRARCSTSRTSLAVQPAPQAALRRRATTSRSCSSTRPRAVDDAEHARLLAKAEAEGIQPTFEA